MITSIDKIQAKMNGQEGEALFRRSRRMSSWPRGELRRIKRAYGKKVRQAAKKSLRVSHDQSL